MIFTIVHPQTIPTSREKRERLNKKRRKTESICRNLFLSPSLSIHHYLSHCPPKQFSPCTLQGKYRMLWTDLSFLKDCWHLSSAPLNLRLAPFSRAHTCGEGEVSRKCFLLMKTGPQSVPLPCTCLYDCHWSDFEEVHSFILAFFKRTSQNPGLDVR